jgi:shikimate dehydrogenase
MGITGRTAVYAIIGHPVGHSLSPPIYNRAFAVTGRDAVFIAFEVAPADLPVAVAGMRALGLRAFMVTIPHKERMAALLDGLDPSAALTGAVNAAMPGADGRWRGYNTDVAGVRHALERAKFDPIGRTAVVLGAGGAARAAVVALAEAGAARIRVLNRTPERAVSLVADLAPQLATSLAAGPLAAAALAAADLVVNTTTLGMSPQLEESPVPPQAIPAGATVLDAIYRPRETALLRAAAARGARVAYGADWLVGQAAAAFRLWTGEEAPIAEMAAALAEHLKI